MKGTHSPLNINLFLMNTIFIMSHKTIKQYYTVIGLICIKLNMST